MSELFCTTLWNAVRKKQECVQIIKGLICGDNNLIVSESDSFRIRFLLQMIIDMANPNCSSFLDRFAIEKRYGKYLVLFINTENGLKNIKDALRDVSYGMDNQLIIDTISNINFIDCYGKSSLVNDKNNLIKLLYGVIENENPNLIVIDTYSGLNKKLECEVSENQVINDLSEITFAAQQYGIPIILTNKIKVNNPNLDDALRSAIAFTNWSDNIIWLKKNGNDSCYLKKIKSGIEFLTDNSEIGIKFDGKRFHATAY